MNENTEIQIILPNQNKYKKTIYTKLDGGNIFLLATLAPQLLGTILYFFVLIFFGFNLNSTQNLEDFINNSTFLQVLFTVTAQLGFILVFFLYNKLIKTNIKKACKLNFDFPFWTIPLAILMGLIALFGFNPLIISFDYLISLTGHIAKDFPLPLDTIWWLLLNILLLAVLPAIVEELIFRGVILNGFRQYGKIKAIVFSALLFALIHGSIDQTLYPFLFGLLLGIIAVKTNSIIPGMIIHFVNNSTVLIINYIIGSQPFVPDLTYILLSILIAVLCAGILFGLSLLLKSNIKNQNLIEISENEIAKIEQARTQSNSSLWFGIIFSALIWLMTTFS